MFSEKKKEKKKEVNHPAHVVISLPDGFDITVDYILSYMYPNLALIGEIFFFLYYGNVLLVPKLI